MEETEVKKYLEFLLQENCDRLIAIPDNPLKKKSDELLINFIVISDNKKHYSVTQLLKYIGYKTKKNNLFNELPVFKVYILPHWLGVGSITDKVVKQINELSCKLCNKELIKRYSNI